MSLTFLGHKGSFERRWIVYAMLRDNVQHHFEGGTPSGEFKTIHSIGDALVTGRTIVPASALRSEVQRARELLDKPIADLAVSVRTRAVCAMAFPLPETRGTALAKDADWTAPFPLTGLATLGDLFGSFVDELLRITEGGEGEVTVVDS